MFVNRNFELIDADEIYVPARQAPRCYQLKPFQNVEHVSAIQTSALALGLAASVSVATILVAIA